MSETVRVKQRTWPSLLVFVLICFGAAALGSLFTAGSVETWYAGITKPAWTPPNWLFGPVWTLLYLMMAISGWLIWRKRQQTPAKTVLILFGAQLALNTLWSVLFFGLHLTGWAIVDILALWALISWYTLTARRISAPAALLFVPYWAWVSFATALNIAVWRLNRV